ncbi:MAG: hypothetical protein J0L79_01395 [Rickettsiales bacterium]|nr:hypothetical protein [Rickettsiales bacterium]
MNFKKFLLSSIFIPSICLFHAQAQEKLSVVKPEDALETGLDGNVVKNPFTGESGWARKGVIGATEFNIVAMDNLLKKHNPLQEDKEVFWETVRLIDGRIESLRYIGLFDLFLPSEWMGTVKCPARFLTGVLFFKSQKKDIKHQINQLSDSLPQAWRQEIQKLKGDQLPAAKDISLDASEIKTEKTLLPDGVEAINAKNPYTGEEGLIRKGTVNSVIQNVAMLDRFFQSKGATADALKKFDHDIKPFMDSIWTTGIFNLFSILEWLSDSNKPGRIYMSILVLKHYPNLLTSEIHARLCFVGRETKISLLKKEIIILCKESKK